MFDKNLVDVIIGGKDLDCGSAELRVNLLSVNLFMDDREAVNVLTRGHGSLLLDPIILQGRRPSGSYVKPAPGAAIRLASRGQRCAVTSDRKQRLTRMFHGEYAVKAI
jgi:hypothetical protein